jgi:hypothetical protein
MGDTVYNAVGTAGRACICAVGPNTWIAHWSRGTQKPLPTTCYAKGCGDPATVGAHVKHPDDLRNIWVVPFCQWHNMRPSATPIELKWATVLCGAAALIDCT